MQAATRFNKTKDMDIGDQLLHAQERIVWLWRGFNFAAIIAILALSGLLLVASMYFELKDGQATAKKRGCRILLAQNLSKKEMRDLGCT